MIRRTAAPAPPPRTLAPPRADQRPGLLDLANAPSAMERLADSWRTKA